MPEPADLAVRVALATGRPLLLRGDPGSGKSSLAANVALERGWRYYEQVVTSRTQAQDLLWTFDSIRRLADAQMPRNRRDSRSSDLNDYQYVEPGVLWWSFAPRSAYRRGAPRKMQVRSAVEPYAGTNRGGCEEHAPLFSSMRSTKLDPDVPNGLLVPLGSNQFFVTETGGTVRIEKSQSVKDPDDGRHLIVVTTNEERDSPKRSFGDASSFGSRIPPPKNLSTLLGNTSKCMRVA